MVYLPSGDLLANNRATGSIQRITPDGGYETIFPNRSAYGMVIGPDGMAYTAGTSMVTRTDPSTGQTESIVDWDVNGEPHALDFDKDFTRLLVSSIGPNILYAIDLDENFDAIGTPYVFARFGDGWQDGVAMDACGYIYVPEFWGRSLWRVSPDGTPVRYINWSGQGYQYGHGVVWGTGEDGWREDALYMPMPYNNNRVKEVVVGVPPRTWSGRVINAPLP
jgi:sugar lactone lactonase YvrE